MPPNSRDSSIKERSKQDIEGNRGVKNKSRTETKRHSEILLRGRCGTMSPFYLKSDTLKNHILAQFGTKSVKN